MDNNNWRDGNGYPNIYEGANNMEAINKNQNSGYRPPKKSNFKTYLSLILITSIISSTIVGGTLYSAFSSQLKKQSVLATKTEAVVNKGINDTSSLQNGNLVKTATTNEYSVSQIAKKIGPSIVGIRMTIASSKNNYLSNPAGISKAEGSGIILSKDGYIMTNYHVVEYADPKNNNSTGTTLEVFLPDKRQAHGKFIGGDVKNDLAVIKIDLNNLTVAELGDSSQLEVGEEAIAIGNPLGMEFAGSVTLGVVSALNRQVQTENKTQNMIQTDAAINPGNSGGALVNSHGQVIGINTIKISETGVEGLGFAIPINDAKPIIDQLIMFGYIKGRPILGISGQEVTDAISKQYSMPVGIYVNEAIAGQGADKAGIKKGDVIVSLADKEVKTMKDLDIVKKDYKSGDTVNVVVVRKDTKMTLKLTFSEEK